MRLNVKWMLNYIMNYLLNNMNIDINIRNVLSNTRSSIYFVALILLSVALLGVIPQTVVSIVVLALSLVLILNGDIYMAFPIMIFYYQPLGMLFGMSTFRWFSFLYLSGFLLSRINGEKRSLLQDYEFIIPLDIFLIFSIVAIGFNDFQKGLFALFDVIIIFLLVTKELSDEEKSKTFFSIFVFTAMASFITGHIMGNSMSEQTFLDGVLVDLVRNNSTFEDPNYMGYFFTAAIFSVVAFKPFAKFVNVILIISLYLMLFTSLSITAIIINVLMWCFYLFLERKVFNYLPIIVIAALCMIGIYQYALTNIGSDNSFGQLALRTQEKTMSLSTGDTEGFTTNRTMLTKEHLRLFAEQPPLRQLIGMNSVCPLYRDRNVFGSLAHNEYVDWLLNIGIIGALLMLFFVGKRFWTAISNYREDESEHNLNIVLQKAIWILYAFTLTIFMDFRFMLPLFM